MTEDCDRYVPSDHALMALSEAQQDHPVDLQDIAFPYRATCDVIARCQRIATMLEGHLEARPDMVAAVTKDWTGGHHDEYEDVWPMLESRISGLKEALQLFVGAAEDAWDEADRINSGRAETRESGDEPDPTGGDLTPH